MIELRDLQVTYPQRDVHALRGITLHIAAGEHVALVGPSGSGKSTLLRALLGAVPAAAGMVDVTGIDPNHDGQKALRALRRRAGVIRQGDDLVLVLPAWLNALMGTSPEWTMRDWARVMGGQPPARWVRRLHAVAASQGIVDCLGAPVSQLSGGQRQRVALCRALLPGPSVLLADEPTAQLDPAGAAGVIDALRSVQGVTLVVATHDLAVARAFPRVVAMRDGHVARDADRFTPADARAIYGVAA